MKAVNQVARPQPVAMRAQSPSVVLRKQGLPRKPSFVSKHQCVGLLEKHYEEIRELGQGAFGRIALVREVATGHERVRKTVSTAHLTPELLDMTKKEIELLSSLDHPGVVKLYEYAEDAQRQELVLILEYLPGGSCDQLIAEGQAPPSEALVARLICQLLTSLEYCHSRGIVHRDVKPGNMMLARDAQALGRADCKLIDFGFAGIAKPGADSLVGTAAYIAPEMIRFEPHTPKIDIWSVGVTAFELLSGQAPFGKDADVNLGPNQPIFQRIKQYQGFEEVEDQFNGVHKWWNRRSAECREFVRWLMHPRADVRPTAAEALEHPWLQRYLPRQAPFTREMADSLISYAQAPSVARCCLLIVAGRLGIPDLEQLGAAFLSADGNGDGKISREELEEALENVQGSWWWTPSAEIDVDKVLEAADPDHTGGMGYTDFIAACIYARHGSDEELARQAFYAMDSDRDGWVYVRDIRSLFRERDAGLLQSLPQARPFSSAEWCAIMAQHAKQEAASRKKITTRRVRSFQC